MNKKGIIITIVIVILALLIGFGSCYAIFGTKKCDEAKCNDKDIVEKEHGEENNDSAKDIEEKNHGEEDNDSNFEKNNEYISYDAIFNNFNISLKTEEDIKAFINSSNMGDCTSESIIGSILLNQNVESFKLIYSLRKLIENEEFDGVESFFVKKESYENLISHFFVNNKISSSYIEELTYNAVFTIMGCTEKNCIVTYEVGDGTGPSSHYITKIEDSKRVGSNKVYNVKFVYLEAVFDKNNEQSFHYNILDKKNGKVLKSNIPGEEYDYEKEVEFIEKNINEKDYKISEITFNENNQYVGTKVLN